MIGGSPQAWRRKARARLPRFLFDYLDGAAGTERTLAANRRDLDRLQLRQRVLTGVADADLRTRWFGQESALPIVLGPVGLAGLYARRGEVQAARAAATAGIPFTLSTVSACGLAEVAQAGAPPWFQLYMLRDRAFMGDLIAEAEAAGCEALVFTVDMNVPGVRYRDDASGMSGRNAAVRRVLQALGRPRWVWDVGLHGQPHTLGNLGPVLGRHSGLEDFMGWLGGNFDPGITWRDLEWVRARWRRPLIIKGVLDPDDARAARALGADAIVVSNHGGRQLDGAASSASVLPRIAQTLGDDLVLFADGGVRDGTDVLRMLGLGAHGVWLGRAWVYALAGGGGAGVAALISAIARELRVAMMLTGVGRVADIHRNILETAPWP